MSKKYTIEIDAIDRTPACPVIYKYPLKVTGFQNIELPPDAVVLSIQMQNHVPILWAMVGQLALDAFDPVQAEVTMIGTGDTDIGQHVDVDDYVTTIQMGAFVFHFFVKVPDYVRS